MRRTVWWKFLWREGHVRVGCFRILIGLHWWVVLYGGLTQRQTSVHTHVHGLFTGTLVFALWKEAGEPGATQTGRHADYTERLFGALIMSRSRLWLAGTNQQNQLR